MDSRRLRRRRGTPRAAPTLGHPCFSASISPHLLLQRTGIRRLVVRLRTLVCTHGASRDAMLQRRRLWGLAARVECVGCPHWLGRCRVHSRCPVSVSPRLMLQRPGLGWVASSPEGWVGVRRARPPSGWLTGGSPVRRCCSGLGSGGCVSPGLRGGCQGVSTRLMLQHPGLARVPRARGLWRCGGSLGAGCCNALVSRGWCRRGVACYALIAWRCSGRVVSRRARLAEA